MVGAKKLSTKWAPMVTFQAQANNSAQRVPARALSWKEPKRGWYKRDDSDQARSQGVKWAGSSSSPGGAGASASPFSSSKLEWVGVGLGAQHPGNPVHSNPGKKQKTNGGRMEAGSGEGRQLQMDGPVLRPLPAQIAHSRAVAQPPAACVDLYDLFDDCLPPEETDELLAGDLLERSLFGGHPAAIPADSLGESACDLLIDHAYGMNNCHTDQLPALSVDSVDSVLESFSENDLEFAEQLLTSEGIPESQAHVTEAAAGLSAVQDSDDDHAEIDGRSDDGSESSMSDHPTPPMSPEQREGGHVPGPY